MSHEAEHFEDGMCVCACELCADAAGEVCYCPECNAAACGLHVDPPKPDPLLDAFAAHLTERGMTSCGPIAAVREYLRWSRDAT